MYKIGNYIPALDGIRAVSISLVLIAHIGFDAQIPGGLGVTVFFYVSGLLITNLLLAEFKNSNTINFKKFYIRRVLRLYPPILLLVLFTLSIPVLNKTVRFNELMAALFYYENYFYISHYEALKNVAGFGFFWSLSVEEHFYIIFPFIFLSLVKFPKTLLGVLGVLVVLSLCNRLYIASLYNANEFSGMYNYLVTTCRVDTILAGCLSSIILNVDGKKQYLNFVSKFPVFVGALMILVATIVFRNEFFRQTFRYTLQNLVLMMVIPPIIYSRGYSFLNKIFSSRPFVFVGKLSYSLYLFHQAAYILVDTVIPVGKTFRYISCGLGGAFILALASYYLVERPVTKWRRRFGSGVALAAGSNVVTPVAGGL